MADLIAGFSAPSGYGHNYAIDFVSGWAAVVPTGAVDGGRQRPAPAAPRARVGPRGRGVSRDAVATAAVFGFFASAWFGWAQDQPPPAWRRWLVAGSVLSLLTAVGGGVLTWRNWTDPTAFDAGTSRTFGLVVGVEVALAAIGAAVLARRRSGDLIPAWVALVVGVHLIPVAWLLRYPLIGVTGALVTLVAVGRPAGRGPARWR